MILAVSLLVMGQFFARSSCPPGQSCPSPTSTVDAQFAIRNLAPIYTPLAYQIPQAAQQVVQQAPKPAPKPPTQPAPVCDWHWTQYTGKSPAFVWGYVKDGKVYAVNEKPTVAAPEVGWHYKLDVADWSWGYLYKGLHYPSNSESNEPKPFGPPSGQGANAKVKSYGLSLDKLESRSEGEKFRGSGPNARAFNALVQGKASLSDDSTKIPLTVVGDEAFQAKVREALSDPKLKDELADCHVQVYKPGDWAVQQIGMPPGVLIQTSAGEPVWRSIEPPSAEQISVGLAKARKRLRERNPNLKPDSIPGPDSASGPSKSLEFVLAGLVGLFGLLHLRKDSQ